MSYKISTTATSNKLVLNETDTVASVVQNIKIILQTRKLTVPLYREFGMDMTWLDKPIPLARSKAVMCIKEAIEKFEPRATFLGVTFEQDAASPGLLIPIVEVEIDGE